MYQITFYVPASHLDKVKQALFSAGAGRYRSYDQCSWQTLGQGQFRPLAGAQPYLGVAGQLTKIAEYKVEMICESANLPAALNALFASHPYEQPAYAVQKILQASDIAD
ncbi:MULTISPECIES: NGG1p interacting factor NIF3 [Methylomonas]|uniref:NGG1p interacting factor NIF3 n=1 Tax=Methylomonas TaxID=416 RepID=UPI001231AA53|nr:NGG1p interacting factor NIF3 [Methylomonas rhizoryzae]